MRSALGTRDPSRLLWPILFCCALTWLGGEAQADPSAALPALRRAVKDRCPGLRLETDPALARAAARFVSAAAKGTATADHESLTWFARAESELPATLGGLATIEGDNPEAALGDLLPPNCSYDRVGAAWASRGRRRWIAAVLVGRSLAQAAPLPSTIPVGGTLELAGHLAAPLHHPRLFVSKPDGTVTERALGTGTRFEARIQLTQPGAHSIEVLADGPGGPQVALIRAVSAGIAAPALPPRTLAFAGATDLGAVEAAIGRLRREHGLPALSRDPALDRVAERHSQLMARTRTFAHVLREDKDIADRLRRARYGYRHAGENIGLADTPLSAHRAIEESPAHLANLLGASFRRVGLGAVRGESPDGSDSIYLTEVLADPVQTSADPTKAVRAELQARRAKAGLKPLVDNPELDRLAQRELDAVLREKDARIRPDVSHKALEEVPELLGAQAELVLVSEPEDIADSVGTERGWTQVGVAAGYLSTEKYGPERLWAMLIFAR